jgi:hypothetical protein
VMWRSKILYLFLVVLLMIPPMIPVTGKRSDAAGSSAQPSTRLRTSVIGAAGRPGSSPGCRGNGTLGQPSVIGKSDESDKVAYLGFWKGGWISIVTESETPPAYCNELLQNYPNPFNPVTTISYYLPDAARVTLNIYDVSGHRIACLVDEYQEKGRHYIQWNGEDSSGIPVSSGVYFYRMQADKETITRKMALLR